MNIRRMMTSRGYTFLLLLIALAVFANPAQTTAQIPLNDDNTIRLIGDIRTGYIGFVGEQRNGDRLSRHELRNRTRVGFELTLSRNVLFNMRYAGRISTYDFHFNPGLHTTAAGNNGLLLGEGAFDQFYVSTQLNEWLSVKAGRFQTSFTLDGNIKNSILRQDSPNTDISWTDGLHFKARATPSITADLVLQSHIANPTTNVFRKPLDIPSSDVPITLFLNLKKDIGQGFLNSFAINLTYTPDALIMSSDGRRSGYFAASIKPQLRKVFSSGRKLLFGTELAYSFKRPNRDVFGFTENGGGHAGGFGFQSTLTLMDVLKGQHLGVMATMIGPSLLTSSAFWNNLLLFEVRHSIKLGRKISSDLRLRYRADLETLNPELNNRRWQLYPFARVTYKF